MIRTAIAGMMWLVATGLAGACGLDGIWEFKISNGDHGLLHILDQPDQNSCNSQLLYYDVDINKSATEKCFVLNSGDVTIMCEVISTTATHWTPESFSLQRVSATEMRGLSLQHSRKVTFTKK
jgi:hypothetical protein